MGATTLIFFFRMSLIYVSGSSLSCSAQNLTASRETFFVLHKLELWHVDSITVMWAQLPRVCGEEPAGQCRGHKRRGLDAWVRKIPCRRACQPTPVFLPRGA